MDANAPASAAAEIAYRERLTKALARELGPRLAFEQELETRYRRYNAETALRLQRLGFPLVGVIVGAYVALDIFFHGRFGDPVFAGLVAALGLLTLLVWQLPRVWPWLQSRMYLLIALLMAANSVLVAAAITRSAQIGLGAPYEFMLLQLIYAFFLTGMLFRTAFVVAAWSIVALVVAEGLSALPAVTRADHFVFLLLFTATCGLGGYIQERIRRQKWLQAQLLAELAEHDELTGLHSRRYLMERGDTLMRLAQRESKPLSLLMVDVDLFKRYNDTLGHPSGDRCLRELADAISESARRPLDIAARYGGEEFVVLLYDCASASASQHAEKLRHQVEKLGILHPGVKLGLVTVSVGVASAPAGALTDLDTLIAAADAALYQAKRNGRNRVWVHSELMPPPAPIAPAAA